MSNKNSNATVGSKSVNNKAAKQKQQVSNPATNSTRRVVETRDQWQVIFDYSVFLIVGYCRNQKPDVKQIREGFGFTSAAEQPHSRAYAKSLIWGFATNKAGKVLKDFDELADKPTREKIAKAILLDCKLVKGSDNEVVASLNKVEPKREKAVAQSVLAELTKPTEPTTTSGGKKKGNAKPATPKGSQAKAQPKAEKPTSKGGKESDTHKAAK